MANIVSFSRRQRSRVRKNYRVHALSHHSLFGLSLKRVTTSEKWEKPILPAFISNYTGTPVGVKPFVWSHLAVRSKNHSILLECSPLRTNDNQVLNQFTKLPGLPHKAWNDCGGPMTSKKRRNLLSTRFETNHFRLIKMDMKVSWNGTTPLCKG